MADSSELDDENDKVLEKFNFLIEKYHHQDHAVNETPQITESDDFPVLTESVRLKPAKGAQQEFGELSPLRLLLDAALQDANVDLTPADRQALVRALENRIIVQEKDSGDLLI